ncbi:hypothetical protein BFDFBN_BFDFBN_05245, partial [Dysosmobacter welbionis]
SLPLPAAARSSWNSPEKSWSGVSRMPPPSPPAVCGPPLRPGATPPGIPPRLPSSRRAASASPPSSAPTPARPWTRRRLFCGPWTRSAARRCESCACSGTRRPNGWWFRWGRSRSTSWWTRPSTPSGRTCGC